MKTLRFLCWAALRAALLLTLMLVALSSSTMAQTVLFRDDFNGSTLNSTAWSLGTWTLGRTRLGNAPVVGGGIARLPFDTYKFKGCEIYTRQGFTLGTGLELEARVKLNQLPSGLVTSVFTYAFINSLSDEIDFEMLSKQVNLTTGGDPILCTTWNDWNEALPTYQDGVHHYSQNIFRSGLDANQWHTYIIRWRPGSVTWLLDGNVIATAQQAVPDAATPLRLNFWAPASGWTDAYDASLVPVNSPKKNKRYFYDVDYVEVRRLP